MANSKYEYVRSFERDEILLPNTWIVVRIDGRGFHKLSSHYNFAKPNDARALDLMNAAAKQVVTSLADIAIAYGVSDEYSFVFQRATRLFERRAAKLASTVVSSFTAAYVFLWAGCFGTPLEAEWLPSFDARAVVYPGVGEVRDYLAWRQVDCHINNLYNTTFWAMVQQGGLDTTVAENELKGTVSADKNEILWSRYGINYNDEPEMYKKGSVVFREYALEDPNATAEETTGAGIGATVEPTNPSTAIEPPMSKTQQEKARKARQKARVVVEHLDIIRDDFWKKRPWILDRKPGRPVINSEP